MDNPAEEFALIGVLKDAFRETATDGFDGFSLFQTPVEYTVTMAAGGGIVAIESKDKLAEEMIGQTALHELRESLLVEAENEQPTAKFQVSFKIWMFFQVIPIDESSE